LIRLLLMKLSLVERHCVLLNATFRSEGRWKQRASFSRQVIYRYFLKITGDWGQRRTRRFMTSTRW